MDSMSVKYHIILKFNTSHFISAFVRKRKQNVFRDHLNIILCLQ